MVSTVFMTIKVLAVLYGAVELFAYLLKEEDAKWVKGMPRTLLMSLFVIGLWAHYVGVIYLAIFLFAAFLPKSRAEAAAAFAIILVAVPSLSMEWTIGGLYLFAINKYIPMALGLGVATMMRPKDRGVPAGRHFDLPLLLILLLGFVAVRDPKITVAELEKRWILKALLHFDGNKTQAANALGITIKTLYNKLHEYGEFEKFAVHSKPGMR